MSDLSTLPPLDPASLSGKNGQLFAYWQSLRKGRSLPRRADFDPRQAAVQLPTLTLFQVWPHSAVSCRLAGTQITQGLGMDLTGKDYLALTPAHFRAERLSRFTEYTTGIIARAIRQLDFNTESTMLVEELSLPFGDVQEDGSYHVLIHCAGGVVDRFTRVKSASCTLDAPLVYERYRP